MRTLTKEEMRNLVETAVANRVVEIKNYAKFARIQAIQAKGGEKIETVLADGTKETTNTAAAGDWIVTNPGGERYVVAAAKFPKKYEPCPELGEGWFKPTGGVQKFMTAPRDFNFICSWNEEQFIAAGGFINITDLGDIYGVAREEFLSTYKECDNDGNFLD